MEFVLLAKWEAHVRCGLALFQNTHSELGVWTLPTFDSETGNYGKKLGFNLTKPKGDLSIKK